MSIRRITTNCSYTGIIDWMELLTGLVDIVLHLDRHLVEIVENYGTLTYAVLFFIVFMETGFVVTPFLPGDSLLFAAGTIASKEALNINLSLLILATAAVIGDTINYWVGFVVGPKVFRQERGLVFNKKHLVKTHTFYEKHGGKTIILARFIPIIRTFAPFVAGIGKMNYAKFLVYNVIGGISWVFIFTLAGFWFGNVPIVRENFSLVIIAIILISVTPIFIEVMNGRSRRSGVKINE